MRRNGGCAAAYINDNCGVSKSARVGIALVKYQIARFHLRNRRIFDILAAYRYHVIMKFRCSNP